MKYFEYFLRMSTNIQQIFSTLAEKYLNAQAFFQYLGTWVFYCLNVRIYDRYSCKQFSNAVRQERIKIFFELVDKPNQTRILMGYTNIEKFYEIQHGILLKQDARSV